MESDLTTKCRGCLAEEPEMHNLFNLITEDLTLANILSETTSTQIEESEELSPYLCLKCTGIIVEFYNFKTQFAKSRTYFQNELTKLKDDSLTRFIILKNQDRVSKDINVKEEIEVLDNSKDLVEKKPKQIVKSKKQKDFENNLSPFLITVSNNENNCDVITETNKQITPEVGEFTVENELVQLIESVVFCCKICNKEFLLKDYFLTHMNNEHDQLSVDPSKFTKRTLVKLPLAKVIEENSDHDSDFEQQQICKICNILVLKSEFECHREEHKIYICHCGAKFLRKSLLVNHEKSVHSEERDFVCKYCNKAFKTKQVLTKHLKYHTHPRSEICHICGQIFNDKSVLNTHIKLKHFPTRDFQCTQCGLKFPLKSTLEKHFQRHHTNNRKKTFSCSKCNMSYFEKSTLNRHVSIKHSDQPIKAKCEYCGKTFTTKSNLYKHLRTSHKHDTVIISKDGNITVQKST